MGESTDQFVALVVADQFVDLLEAADVDVDEEDRLAGPDCGLRGLGDLADHRLPRENAGQLVEMGLLDDVAHRLVDAGEEGHRGASSRQRAQRRNDRTPTTSAGRPATPSPKPNFKPHRPRMKLPSPELAIVISRNTGLRLGLLTAGIRKIPDSDGILSTYPFKIAFPARIAF